MVLFPFCFNELFINLIDVFILITISFITIILFSLFISSIGCIMLHSIKLINFCFVVCYIRIPYYKYSNHCHSNWTENIKLITNHTNRMFLFIDIIIINPSTKVISFSLSSDVYIVVVNNPISIACVVIFKQ